MINMCLNYKVSKSGFCVEPIIGERDIVLEEIFLVIGFLVPFGLVISFEFFAVVLVILGAKLPAVPD